MFAHPPADPTSAFVPLHGVELDAILCEHEARTVSPDNVVTLDDAPLQIAKQPGRRTCAGLRVTVRPENARAHVPQDRRSSPPPMPSIPRRKRRTGPRLPTGPRA